MNNTCEVAPIVLFTYNRLNCLKQTIDALKNNILADESVLYVFSDGYKNKEDEDEVTRVREYLKEIKGFRRVIINERKENLGLAANIESGVTTVVNEHGRVIVLEDDIVTSKYFLKYMNDALHIYENQDEVMTISGYAYPMDIHEKDFPETVFLHFSDCWGWATWKRAWASYERNPSKLLEEFDDEDIYHFNLEGKYPFWKQVLRNAKGKRCTWAIFWQASVYKKDGYVLYPTRSLVKNVGFDGSGTHKAVRSSFDTSLLDHPIECFPSVIEENQDVRNCLGDFLNSLC